jgi:F-type H+-transporting ATPase subunit b
MRIKNIALFVTVLVPSLVLATGAEHHDVTMFNSDFFYRVFNFTIFAGLVYYLVANPIKEFFIGRAEGIANRLKEIEEKLQATKNAKKEAEANLLKAEAKATEIISDAAKEAKLLSSKIVEKSEETLTLMEKQAIEKQVLETKKAARTTIDNVLNEGITNDDISIDESKVVSLISKKVA